jgi:hypothetical protein
MADLAATNKALTKQLAEQNIIIARLEEPTNPKDLMPNRIAPATENEPH